jgi:hypothetical protein
MSPNGDDLRDFVPPVFAHGIFDHLASAIVGKVKIDIGHADAARVEETLEDQTVRQRIEQCDLGCISHDAAGG